MSKPKQNRPASGRTLAAATNPTRRMVEAAAALAVTHPAEYADALRLVAALAQPHANADEVTAWAQVTVASHVTDPDRTADWRKASRAAVKHAAAAIARSTLGTGDQYAGPIDPADLTDDARAALVHDAPDPAATWRVTPGDLIAATVDRAPLTPGQRTALREALARSRREGVPYTRTTTPRAAQRAPLTTAEDGSAWRARVAAALVMNRRAEAEVLADPFEDGTAREPNDWTHHGPATGSALPDPARPTPGTLAALARTATARAAHRDTLRLHLALAHADHWQSSRDRAALALVGIALTPTLPEPTAPDADALAALAHAWRNASRLATRAAAGLAAAETHAARAGRRTDVQPHGLPTYEPERLAAPAPRQPVEKKDRPAQVPAWQTRGGTARPLVGALVAQRDYGDTGTPGISTRVTVTAPDGTVWLNRWTAAPLTGPEVTALSAALAAEADTAADALALVERRLAAPPLGKPKTPSRKPSRVGNTGPTVGTFSAVGMTR